MERNLPPGASAKKKEQEGQVAEAADLYNVAKEVSSQTLG